MDHLRAKPLGSGDEALVFVDSSACVKYHYALAELDEPAERRARREFETMRAVEGIRGVPRALSLDERCGGTVESLLIDGAIPWLFTQFGVERALALLARGTYCCALTMEYLRGAPLLRSPVQPPEFFDDLRRIAAEVNSRGYTLPRDLHAKNVLVVDGTPAVIDWTKSERLETDQSYLARQSASITRLEQRFGYD